MSSKQTNKTRKQQKVASGGCVGEWKRQTRHGWAIKVHLVDEIAGERTQKLRTTRLRLLRSLTVSFQFSEPNVRSEK